MFVQDFIIEGIITINIYISPPDSKKIKILFPKVIYEIGSDKRKSKREPILNFNKTHK
jgi:hypothetical protein